MLARVVSKSTRTRTWTCAPLGFSGLARRWINTGESILAGDDIPLKVVRNGEPKDESINSLFKGKKVAVFGVPGAFTPVYVLVGSSEYRVQLCVVCIPFLDYLSFVCVCVCVCQQVHRKPSPWLCSEC